jgi:hypothetical protein
VLHKHPPDKDDFHFRIYLAVFLRFPILFLKTGMQYRTCWYDLLYFSVPIVYVHCALYNYFIYIFEVGHQKIK